MWIKDLWISFLGFRESRTGHGIYIWPCISNRRGNHSPCAPGSALVNSALGTFGLLRWQSTLMCNLSLPIHQQPQVLFSSFSKLSTRHLVPSCLLGTFLPRYRRLHLSLLGFIKPSSLFLQPVKVSLNGSPDLKGPFSPVWRQLQTWKKYIPSPDTYW